MKKPHILPRLAALGIFAAILTTIAAGTPAASAQRAPVDPPVFGNPLNITNRFHPFVVGAVKVYSGRSDGERTNVVDTYLADTRTFRFNGRDVATHILVETEFEGGRLVEISYNYFAQSDDGVAYYFGEVVDIYEDDEVVSHDGSWLVGGPTQPTDPPETGNAPRPAVFMLPAPKVGDVFKPEDLYPLVDETVTVKRVDRTVVVPAGKFRKAIEVRETSRLSPGHENKWYAPGVGVVRVQAKGEWLKLDAVALLGAD